VTERFGDRVPRRVFWWLASAGGERDRGQVLQIISGSRRKREGGCMTMKGKG